MSRYRENLLMKLLGALRAGEEAAEKTARTILRSNQLAIKAEEAVERAREAAGIAAEAHRIEEGWMRRAALLKTQLDEKGDGDDKGR